MSEKMILTFDGGTSLSKIIYRIIKDGKSSLVKYLTSYPEVIKLISPPKKNNFGEEKTGWVQLSPKRAQQYYAVGKLAKDLGATSSIRRLKYEGFVPKILATIGEIATREKLSERFNLDLYLLLPYSEYENRSDLESTLSKALKLFWCGNSRIKANLDEYRCYPEGLGIALEVRRRLEKSWKAKRIGILIFGYRNTSWLVFEKGVFSQSLSKSTNYGFFHLLDFVASLIPGVSREEIQDAIVTKTIEYVDRSAQKRRKQLTTSVDWKSLVKETFKETLSQKILRNEAALSNGKLQYWELINSLLYEVAAHQVDTIYYGGGGSIFIKDKLREYCQNENTPIISSSELNRIDTEVKTLPPLRQVLNLSQIELESFIAQNLDLRAADAWHLFANITDYHSELTEAISA